MTISNGCTRLESITLQASGTGNDAADVSTVRLWADVDGDGSVSAGDTELGTGSYSADNGVLQLSINSVPDLQHPVRQQRLPGDL